MSRKTAAQRRGSEEQKRVYAAQLREIEEADRKNYRHKAALEKQRAHSATIANDDDRAWAKRSHAVARAQERHGAVTDLFGLREIEGRIKTGRTVQHGLILLGHTAWDRLYRRSSIWLATVAGRVVPIVYDHDAEAITTVLPMDARHLRFEDGYFVRLVAGGTKAGREYWAAITQ